ncbi:MAG: hypothetical protein ACI4F4_04590 [Lachnospiraceae bacterium]
MGHTYRQLERSLYQNPILDIKEFPPLEKDNLSRQKVEVFTFDFSANDLCYIYIREHNKSWFVDIYLYREVYSVTEDEQQIHMDHFIIAPGYQMSEEEERTFIYRINKSSVLFSNCVGKIFVEEISKVAPELNMKPYNNIGLALYHTYYASSQNGIRTLLLKEGLECIASDLCIVEGWNIVARDIETAFKMPIELLKKLNSHRSVEMILALEEGRQKAIIVFKKFHEIMNDIKIINELQLEYLYQCFLEDTSVDKKWLLELETLGSDVVSNSGELEPENDEFNRHFRMPDKICCFPFVLEMIR